jgi:glutamine amidotransferase
MSQTEKKIIIVDYGMGNLFSIRKVIERIGFTCQISNNYADIKNAAKLILPGVGHFGKAMSNLQEANLIDELHEAVLVKKTPVLGICLGMQLMASHSEEGDSSGLNWIPGRVVRFQPVNGGLYKVPHVGWNTISHENPDSDTLKKINMEDAFYFVHSYHVVTEQRPDVLSETPYEQSFVSSIEKDNITGVQFHPEKSHKAGEQLIKNFLTK